MALPKTINDREYQKFIEDEDGNVAINVKLKDATISGDVDIDVSAFKDSSGDPQDALVDASGNQYAYLTDGTNELDLAVDDSAMPATPKFIPIGGEYRASKTTYSDGDATVLQTDASGNLKVTGGASSVSAEYVSPSDFTATYTSTSTITLTGVPFTVTSPEVVYIKYIPTGGSSAATLVNGADGVTMTISSNVITVNGAGTPFASGDAYEVGINGQKKAYDSSTNSTMVSSLVNVWNQYTDPETLVTAQNLTAAYADFGSEIDMRGFNRLGVYVVTDVNDSENVTLQVLGKHTSAGTDEYSIDGISAKTLWTTSAIDSKLYFEFDVGTIPFIQLQSIAGTTGYTPAYLTGGSSAEATFGTWEAVTDGSFRITIDGTARNIDGIDFSGDGSMDDVAATIQAAIRAVTGSLETCVWSTDHFIISSVLDASTSAITVTSTSTGTVGTDISGAGAADWMDCDSGNGTVTALAGTIGDLTIVIDKKWRN